jgi:hypothetical protein
MARGVVDDRLARIAAGAINRLVHTVSTPMHNAA